MIKRLALDNENVDIDVDGSVNKAFTFTVCPVEYSTHLSPTTCFRLRLHVQSISPLFVPFKNGYNTVLWNCYHVKL